jgi:CRP/FNR family transcriptional regulator, anaerobic regulatory protein
MESIQRIKQMLFSLQPLTEAEWENHIRHFIFKSFKKGDALIKEGDTENNIYYIESGATRNYFVRNGKEFTIDFHFEGDFVTAYYSLITGQPSIVTIELVSDTNIIVIPYRLIQNLHKESVNTNIIGRKMAEMHYIKRLKKEMDLLSLTAEERYAQLLNLKPEIVRAISVKHLSSYLGIQPESLSRIRKNYSEN